MYETKKTEEMTVDEWNEMLKKCTNVDEFGGKKEKEAEKNPYEVESCLCGYAIGIW